MSLEFLKDNLIEALTKQALSLNDKDLSSLDIVLPTQRLALQLDLKLSQELKSYLPPQFFTLESYLNHLYQLNTSQKPPELLNKTSLIFLIPHILNKNKFKTIYAFNCDSYLKILENIYSSSTASNIEQRMQEAAEQTVNKHENHQKFILDKKNDLLLLDKVITNYCQTKQVLAYYQWPFIRSQSLKESIHIEKQTWIAGLTTLRYQDAHILAQIKDHEKVHVLFHQEQPKISPVANKKLLFNENNQTNKLEDNVQKAKTYLLKCASPLDEVQNAFKLVEQLLESNIPENQIFIGVTNESFYKKYLSNELKKFPGKYNLALGEKVLEQGVGSLLYSLKLFLQGKNLETADFLALSEDLQTENTSGYGKLFGDDSLKSVRFLKELNVILHQGKNQLVLEATALTLSQQCQQLKKILADYDLINKLATTETEQNAWQSFEQLLANIEENNFIQNEKHTFDDFLTLLIKACQSSEVHHKGSAFAGIQILRLSELRWIKAGAIILLGCQDSDLPSITIDESVIDLAMQHKLELPIPETLEKLEFLHLEMLRSNTQNLFLSYSSSIKGKQQTPAAICHLWLAQRECKRLDPSPSAQDDGATHLPRQRLDLQRQRHGSQDDLVPPRLPYAQPIEQLSAKSAQNLLHCPLRYALDAVKIDSFETAENLENRDIGIFLHQVIHVFFTGSLKNKQLLPEWTESQEQDISSYYLKRLNQALQKTPQPLNVDLNSLILQLQQHSWPRLSRFLAAFFPEKDCSVISQCMSEVSLKKFKPLLEINSHQFSLIGQIDFLKKQQQPLLIDFKKSSTPSGSDLKNQYDIQLSFYAMALANSKSSEAFSSMKLGYWNILRGEWNEAFELGAQVTEEKDKKAKANKSKDARAYMDAFKTSLTSRLEQLDQQQYFQADDFHCGFCSYQGICRKNDSRYDGHFSKTSLMESPPEKTTETREV